MEWLQLTINLALVLISMVLAWQSRMAHQRASVAAEQAALAAKRARDLRRQVERLALRGAPLGPHPPAELDEGGYCLDCGQDPMNEIHWPPVLSEEERS